MDYQSTVADTLPQMLCKINYHIFRNLLFLYALNDLSVYSMFSKFSLQVCEYCSNVPIQNETGHA